MTNPRVVFAGTPDFALASLRALVDADVVPVAVLTQPDRPAGRGKKLTASPVKTFALEQGIAVLQPATLRDADAIAQLAELRPDMLIVAAYGLILPQEALDVPTYGCLNVHASLLPRWRGAAPIQAAILHGDTETGISLMAMTAGLDCGPVYVAESVPIGDEETAGELHDRLAVLGGQMLQRHLDDIMSGRLDAIEQDESLVAYAPKISKQDAVMDWRRSSHELHQLVRAYNPVPGAWFEFGGERIKCWEVRRNESVSGEPGEVVSSGRAGLTIACGAGGLDLVSLQRPGKGRVTGSELSGSIDLADKVLSAPA